MEHSENPLELDDRQTNLSEGKAASETSRPLISTLSQCLERLTADTNVGDPDHLPFGATRTNKAVNKELAAAAEIMSKALALDADQIDESYIQEDHKPPPPGGEHGRRIRIFTRKDKLGTNVRINLNSTQRGVGTLDFRDPGVKQRHGRQ